MQKKRSGWLTLLIYLFVGIFSAVIIYSIINGVRNNYTTISSGSLIKLAYDNNDEYIVTDAEIIRNDDEAIVKLGVKNKETNETAFFKVECESNIIYEVLDVKFNEKYVSIYEALLNQVIQYHEGTTDSYINHWNSYKYQESVLLSWLPTIISTIVTVGIAIFFFKFLLQSSGSNKQALDFNKSRARKIDNSKVRFADVAGCDGEKAEMVEIVDYLKNPKKYTTCGAKLPKGIILVGPPGTGKTLLAKAVAGEAGVPFFSISGFVEMFVGVGAGRVRDLFKTAKQNAPCLIFIDEIDAVGRQRGAGLGGGNDEREQTLNQLLVELDGFEENSGIMVIAATNRDDVLDPALLRAGRFDRKITVNLPDKKGRSDIFKVHARGKKIDPEIDFDALARRTVGFSGADIANILNESAILAVRGNRELISLADIDEAIDRRIAGPAKSNKRMSENERKLIAYHESGHAIVGLTLPHSDKVRKITIIPRGETGGHVLMTPEDDRFLLTKSELEAEIVGLLGGRTSEEIFFKDITTGASNDIERATQIARAMVVEYGMSSLGPIQYERNGGSVFLGRDYTNSQKNFSMDVANQIDTEVRKIIETAHATCKKILSERKDDVKLIAETLLENETINEEQIDYLIKNRKLPDDTITQKQAANRVDANDVMEDASKDEVVVKENKVRKPRTTTKEQSSKKDD